METSLVAPVAEGPTSSLLQEVTNSMEEMNIEEAELIDEEDEDIISNVAIMPERNGETLQSASPESTWDTPAAVLHESLKVAEPVDVSLKEATDDTEEDPMVETSDAVVASKASGEKTLRSAETPRSNKTVGAASSAQAKPGLLSLPIDALHSIASFLTPSEWCCLGQTDKTSNRVYHQVVKRVRMHGFRCATEIVTSWKLGQHADAKELVALYIQAGVPVYPQSLGHSYHTLVWRMGVEASTMQEQQVQVEPSSETTEEEEEEVVKTTVDPFYTERAEFRTREGYNPHITYLEEKTVFGMSKNPASDATRRLSVFPFDPQPRRMATPMGDGLEETNALGETADEASGGASPKDRIVTSPPHIALTIHQHLHDRHIVGKVYTDDKDGTMVTPPVSLSADFFHPTSPCSPGMVSPVIEPSTDEVKEEGESLDAALAAVDTPLHAESDVDIVHNPDEVLEDNEEEVDAAHFEPPPPLSAWRLQSVLKYLDLELYTSATTGNLKSTSDVADGSTEMKRHLRSRFATYQRRLEMFLVQGDNPGFEECILNFWDEFFPQSSMIHYFDQHTAIPRISGLGKFLTRPCPKAIGTIQCEIERVKINPKGKGVSMKGRLFPTYEYRLFIRDRKLNSNGPETAAVEEEGHTRRDTVLMVARNKGRKHVSTSGVVPASSSSKKGSNNYYMHVAEQADVDDHYNKANNETEHPTTMNPNGVRHGPIAGSAETGPPLLGRLQSNFIGTEFEIFTPRLRKRPRRKPDQQSNGSRSDEEEYDSGMSSDNNSNRRRFGRLSLRRNTSANTEHQTGSAQGDSPAQLPSPQLVKRTKSCPDLPPPQGRRSRSSRRAIANNNPDSQEPVLCEEEDGVITYTANLLGSRPRIMDVCVPKVTLDGVAGGIWKQYLETFEDTEECRMLNCLRQLQALHEAHEQNGDGGGGEQENSAAAAAREEFGLLSLQNRPPWWNIELGSFVLNFGGRVSVASVKNFQLCDRNDQNSIMLQFGRIQGRHSFTMDFQHPLTAVQAFSIAISSLQSKISFG